MKQMQLAGKFDDLGDSLLDMLGDWADRGLQVALIAVVVVTVVRKASLKAGIGALLAMIIALGLYNSRDTLADMFEDEVKNPSNASSVTRPGGARPGTGGVL
ncbi:hypothetical protein STAN_7177 [Streptomyces sp. CBMAI 2042]|uniref:hypothetical protein n=1 Tax=Streptomyces sp. CBMAI 2042 TaxID=2305222 RepID=UPI000F19E063|nr:hypothetical protein [Streptomyces sp. CBMAI 2042]RLV64357.1 hypothetical protein STAN_7177 [Streptomyces sp. CBMAI 2042]